MCMALPSACRCSLLIGETAWYLAALTRVCGLMTAQSSMITGAPSSAAQIVAYSPILTLDPMRMYSPLAKDTFGAILALGPLVIFLLGFLAGLGVLAWMVRLVLRAGREESA